MSPLEKFEQFATPIVSREAVLKESERRWEAKLEEQHQKLKALEEPNASLMHTANTMSDNNRNLISEAKDLLENASKLITESTKQLATIASLQEELRQANHQVGYAETETAMCEREWNQLRVEMTKLKEKEADLEIDREHYRKAGELGTNETTRSPLQRVLKNRSLISEKKCAPSDPGPHQPLPNQQLSTNLTLAHLSEMFIR